MLLLTVHSLLSYYAGFSFICLFFFFQAEDGIRDLVRSRGLGDVYKRQVRYLDPAEHAGDFANALLVIQRFNGAERDAVARCLADLPLPFRARRDLRQVCHAQHPLSLIHL